MKRFSDIVVNKRKIIVIVIIAALALSVAGLVYFIIDDRINSDMLEYLPENTSTTQGIRFLQENFGVKGDAFIVVEGEAEDTELEEKIAQLKQIDGVSQFFWVGDVENITQLGGIIDRFFPNVGINIDTEQLTRYLKAPINPESQDTKYNYVALMLFDYSPSTQEAFGVHEQIGEILHDRSYAISGMTALAKQVMEDTLAELPYYLLFSLLAVSIVLLLATRSLFEPVVLMLTLLVAVIINFGTNLIFPSVSIISFAASGVLQLGIAMDYAIFFMHTYNELRADMDATVAAKKALPRVFTAIFASSLTTIGGFAALYFMEFNIGADLAKVVIKGILMSLASVVFLQPALVVMFDKPLMRTAHKPLHINVDGVCRFSVKKRIFIMTAAALLIVPAFLAQRSVNFSYLKIYEQPKEMNAQQRRAAELGNQVISAVPLKTKTGGQKDYMSELMQNERISNVIGAYSAIDMDEETLGKLLDVLLSKPSDSEMLKALSTLFRKVDGRWYTLYLLEIVGDTEDEAAFAAHEHMVSVNDKYFDENYPLGILTGVNDMAEVTPKDFLKVTLASVAIILLIMAIMLKSFRKSLLVVLLIELAIWLNISLNYVTGRSINFMVYIIISSVQLGCTVDYAILLCTRFEELKHKYFDTRQAATEAAISVFPAITTSAAIIFVTCFAITLVSNNLLVEEMSWMLAIGALISYTLVVLVLPGLLVFFKNIVPIRQEIKKIMQQVKKK